MAADSRSQSEEGVDAPDARSEQPSVTACESRPGTVVFIESDNTDGWISSDVTVDVDR